MRRTERKEWFVIDKVWKKGRSRSSFGIFHKEEESDNKAKHKRMDMAICLQRPTP